MPDLRNMTTEAAEAYRRGWEVAREAAARVAAETWPCLSAVPAPKITAPSHVLRMSIVAAIRAMEPGE